MNFFDKNSQDRLTQYLRNYYPYIVFFALMMFLHLFMGLIHDDVYFSGVLSNQSLLDFIFLRYNTWTSRIIIESFLVILLKENLLIWGLFDSLIYTVGVYLAIKIVNRNDDKNIALLGILLFLMFPFYEMATAGWAATTLNYLWCFSFGMISFLPLINYEEGKKNSIFVYITSVFGLIYAVNQEQSCALIFGFNLLYLVNSIIKKQKINKFNLFAILISILSLIIIMSCPGNSVRIASEMNSWFPAFANLNIIQKLYSGLITTFGTLIQDKIIFTLFYVMLNVCALIKTKNKYLKYVFYFNILFIIFIVIFKTLIDVSLMQSSLDVFAKIGMPDVIIDYTTIFINQVTSFVNAFPTLLSSLKLFGYEGIPNLLGCSALIVILVSCYLLITSCLILYSLYGKDNLFPLVIFIAGFMSKLIMGFSPTVFASGPRTTLFFYMMLIMLILMLLKGLYDENIIGKKFDLIFKMIFGLIVLSVYCIDLVYSLFL